MRKLATIREVKDISPIEGADRIEVLTIDGWKVVAQKGLHQVGDKVVYCEIDSFLPIKPEFEFLRPTSFRTDAIGNEGFRLKTIKMRGQVSQGLVLPIRDLDVDLSDKAIGDDVTELLGIIKWEGPIPAELDGEVLGEFPSFIKKTDEERIQNYSDIWDEVKGLTYWCTEKLDGTSFTAYIKGDHFGVCGRNWEYKESDTNTLWKIARELNLEETLRSLGRDIAIQGEVIGERIQKNLYKLRGQHLYVFNIFDIENYRYCTQNDVEILCQMHGLNQVPVKFAGPLEKDTIEAVLESASGPSELNNQQEREGLVFRALEKDFSFKAISNKFLLKHE